MNAQGICVGYLAVFYDRPMITDSPGGLTFCAFSPREQVLKWTLSN